jgi:hypothetical protein
LASAKNLKTYPAFNQYHKNIKIIKSPNFTFKNKLAIIKNYSANLRKSCISSDCSRKNKMEISFNTEIFDVNNSSVLFFNSFRMVLIERKAIASE